MQYFVKSLVSKHRPPAHPDLSIELSPLLEYRNLIVRDERALIAPVNTHRIGRRMHDILPAPYMEQLDRAIHEAKTTRRAVTCIYDRQPGGTRKTTIVVPKPDIVIMHVTRDK